MANIIIFSHDDHVAHKLEAILKTDDHAVLRCEAAGGLPDEMIDNKTLLFILDARLKWSLCRPLLEHLRQLNKPVLFITADKQMTSHLNALYQGVSDVMTIPFSAKPLTRKVEALLGIGQPQVELKVDEKERVALLDGARVELTAQEMALLLALMENPDAPVSREQLLRKAWGYQSMGETRTVDVHVQRLRKKLGVELIETVYKCGYRLRLA